ncbi:MAG: hypothetical protein WCT37_03260 [Patescibacteria group bacterium]|jgi:hypothetical protein
MNQDIGGLLLCLIVAAAIIISGIIAKARYPVVPLNGKEDFWSPWRDRCFLGYFLSFAFAGVFLLAVADFIIDPISFLQGLLNG